MKTSRTRVVQIEKTRGGGDKDLSGKPQLDMVHPLILELLAEPMMNGEKKGYDRHNWFKGIMFMDSYAAAMRHLTAWFSGEDEYTDVLKDGTEVTGSHINAALWNLSNIALQTRLGRHDLDDRWSRGK